MLRPLRVAACAATPDRRFHPTRCQCRLVPDRYLWANGTLSVRKHRATLELWSAILLVKSRTLSCVSADDQLTLKLDHNGESPPAYMMTRSRIPRHYVLTSVVFARNVSRKETVGEPGNKSDSTTRAPILDLQASLCTTSRISLSVSGSLYKQDKVVRDRAMIRNILMQSVIHFWTMNGYLSRGALASEGMHTYSLMSRYMQRHLPAAFSAKRRVKSIGVGPTESGNAS